jgi:hypothetical protein
MSHKKVLELAHKFAERSRNEQFQDQRDMLEKFSDEYLTKFRTILNEMEGDLRVLREKEFNKSQWKEFGLFWKELIEIYKAYDEKNPYEGAKQLLLFVTSKPKETFIRNLNSDIQKFLKEKDNDFASGLHHAQVNSLKALWDFCGKTAKKMLANPLMKDPRELQTVPPPKRYIEREQETVPNFPVDE